MEAEPSISRPQRLSTDAAPGRGPAKHTAELDGGTRPPAETSSTRATAIRPSAPLHTSRSGPPALYRAARCETVVE